MCLQCGAMNAACAYTFSSWVLCDISYGCRLAWEWQHARECDNTWASICHTHTHYRSLMYACVKVIQSSAQLIHSFISLHAAIQVTIVQVADEHLPRWPITSQAGGVLNSSSSTAGHPTRAAAATLEDGSSSVAATGSRFGFIRDLARRRSRAGAVPVWASFDARDSQVAPLLEYEMQQGEVRAACLPGVLMIQKIS